MPRVAILGGGISGLAAAFRLRELSAEHGVAIEISLFEKSDSVGGCVQTMRENGLIMECGPDSLLVDKPSAASLLRRLQLKEQIIDMRPEFKGARIVHRGRLRPIPSEFRLFTPTSLAALLRGGIFSPPGIARAAMEPFIPPRRDASDESLACFVTRRFGREVLDRLAQPLIGGIYSANPERLSMRATLPQFLDLERRYGSLVRAMGRSRANHAPVRLASLRDGLGCIVDAMSARIPNTIRVRASVTALHRENGAWRITFADGTSGQSDAVICALPAHSAASALQSCDSHLAALLARIRYNSIATVNLAYDESAAACLPRSTGFVVPYVERRQITAATFTTQKYVQRAPDGTALFRAFIGGAFQNDLVDRSDDELRTIAQRELAQLAGVTQSPRHAVITRWRGLLPEYGVGHVELVRELEQRAASLGGLALVGSAYHGVGVPDCVATGEAGAESAFGYIRR